MADACEANMKLSTKIRKLQETIDELEGSLEEWRLDFKALEVENKRLREALKGLMDLTAVAYGHQADACPQYAAARVALKGE